MPIGLRRQSQLQTFQQSCHSTAPEAGISYPPAGRSQLLCCRQSQPQIWNAKGINAIFSFVSDCTGQPCRQPVPSLVPRCVSTTRTLLPPAHPLARASVKCQPPCPSSHEALCNPVQLLSCQNRKVGCYTAIADGVAPADTPLHRFSTHDQRSFPALIPGRHAFLRSSHLEILQVPRKQGCQAPGVISTTRGPDPTNSSSST